MNSFLAEQINKKNALDYFWVVEIALFAVVVIMSRFTFIYFAGEPGKRTLDARKFGLATALMILLSGALTTSWGLNYAVFAVECGIGLVLSLIHPVPAVCFLVANTFLRPWEITELAEMSFIPKTLGGLCAFSWIFHGARTRGLSLLLNWPSRFFFALSGWVLLSALTTGEVEAGISSFANSMMISAIIFLMVVNIPLNRNELRLIEVTLVLAVMGVIALAYLMTLARSEVAPQLSRLEGYGLTGNANDLAALIVLTLPLALVPPLAHKRSIRSWLFAAGSLLVFVPGIWSSESRGAMLALIVAAGSYVLIRSRRPWRVLFAGAVLLPVVLLIISALNFSRKSEDLSGSTESRFSYLVAGVKMAMSNPLMGVGFENYPSNYEKYSPSMEYEWGERTAHSSWVLILAETGIPGLFFLVGLFLTTLRRSWKIRQTNPELMVALCGYGVAMSFLSHTYSFYPYVLFGLVLAAAKIPLEKPIP